jgi:hypothetical protein
MRFLALAALPLLGACAAFAPAQYAAHSAADAYCAQVAPEIREQVRGVLTTPSGNRILVECSADGTAIARLDPKAPG